MREGPNGSGASVGIAALLSSVGRLGAHPIVGGWEVVSK